VGDNNGIVECSGAFFFNLSIYTIYSDNRGHTDISGNNQLRNLLSGPVKGSVGLLGEGGSHLFILLC